MYKKLCNRCYQPSFSSCPAERWICPICTNDLTKIKANRALNLPSPKPEKYLSKNGTKLAPHFNKYA
ncbi:MULTISPECIES: hypothetical protein [Metabacillus]|uniref:Uncharacterized protein n=1 Tax=Metabacillus hrfriensis TaxID=3048891 RepID=A0ACD4R7W5_9BACI|nr:MULTISPECIES: hypothetical protein [Metabacillus]UAL51008.1 hypothetical protein K8L98_17485 [Metabacillus dongyingensis]UOK57009.1 hypothetical protein MGI18_20220 [Bacillus sp. OVS6]USK27285.1 hypothetical protein LIT32_17580 [Bacillus sp. CMF21]WHZ56509.1 hypothetical protein QLQ22_17650 [Metabacillus sp. CT-WN-B3]